MVETRGRSRREKLLEVQFLGGFLVVERGSVSRRERLLDVQFAAVFSWLKRKEKKKEEKENAGPVGVYIVPLLQLQHPSPAI